MSHVIIVKIECNEKGEFHAYNFSHRYDQRIARTAEIEQMLGHRITIFAEARIPKGGKMLILRRARDRLW